MANGSSTIVQRLWNYCNFLRDDGMSYGDYVEQLIYLPYLMMDDENVHKLGKASVFPLKCSTAGCSTSATYSPSWVCRRASSIQRKGYVV